jgi:hypothetical protein
MTQFEQAGRRTFLTPQVALAFAGLIAAAALFAALVIVGPISIGAPAVGEQYQAPARVVESGRQWEQMRVQQMGVTDPLTKSGQDWERQRSQQSIGGNDPVNQSGEEWERQRLQQGY